MFEKVLFATDLSPASNCVMRCIEALRPFGTRQVVLLHALGIRHDDMLQYEVARLKVPTLDEQRKYLADRGFEPIVKIAAGNPAAEIQRTAKEEGVSLIVAGSHGAGLAREILLGSVTLEVLHRATIPVLIIRIRPDTEDGVDTPVPKDFRRHILYTTDFSNTSERSFRYLESLIETGVLRATLMHIQDETVLKPHLESRLGEFNRVDLKRLEKLQLRLLNQGAVGVHLVLRTGLPTREIIRALNEISYSLIIMGSQGRGFIDEVFLGSVSHQVVRHASIPVLLIPAERERPETAG